MNRRNFIKTLAIGLGAAAVGVKAAQPKVYPRRHSLAVCKVYPITDRQREEVFIWLSQQKHEHTFEDGEKIEWHEKRIPYQGDPRLLIAETYSPEKGIKWASIQLTDRLETYCPWTPKQ